jgi:hypothetical protein
MLTAPVQRITGTCTRGTRVSSAPFKIPYGGFSPVRLQTGIPPRLRSPGVARAHTPRQLIRGESSYFRREPQAVEGLSSKRHSPLLTERSRPEVLGSPAGYIVHLGRRLL